MTNRPGIGGGNGIGNIGSGNVGSGNTIGSGNTTINRPSYGGNTINNISGGNRPVGGNGNTFVGGNTIIGGGNNFVGGGNNFVGNGGGNNFVGNGGGNNFVGNGGGNWGVGNWGGGYSGGGFGGAGYGGGWSGPGNGYHSGWASPYYGNWYRGGWGGNGFWAGYGAGALSTFGLGSLGTVLSYPGYSYSSMVNYPVGSYGLYDEFPTWGVSNYSSWGIGSVANSSLYSGYVNPYYAQPVGQPAQATAIYDYSQPINLAATPPDPAVTNTTEQIFSAARDSLKAGDFARALAQTDQILQQTPNVPVVHEFRALSLFALRRYDEAASVLYPVLSAEPGWNWSTMVGLYPDVDTYTNQLRALEGEARMNPNSATAAFLLAYHYMVQGHSTEAATQFERVVQLQPKDTLSASFAKVLRRSTEVPASPADVARTTTPTAVVVAQPGVQPAPPVANSEAASTEETPPPPPPPPASLTGDWKAKPSADVAISLSLKQDGAFIWVADSGGRRQTLEGTAGFKDGTLALLQADGPPLVGKVTQGDPNSFEFRPPNAPESTPGLKFTR